MWTHYAALNRAPYLHAAPNSLGLPVTPWRDDLQSARLFRMFKGNRWKSNGLWTAMLYPGVCFSIFFVLNLLIWGQKSSGAVPFGTRELLAAFTARLPCLHAGSVGRVMVLMAQKYGFSKRVDYVGLMRGQF